MQMTEAQMTAFEQACLRQFALRLCRYIEEGFSGRRAQSGEQVPRGAALEAAVATLIATANRLGVKSELAVGQFVVLGVAYAKDFHQSRRVAELLGDSRASPDRNMQDVLDAVLVAEARSA